MIGIITFVMTVAKATAVWVQANPVLGGLLGASGVGSIWLMIRTFPKKVASNFMEYFSVSVEIEQFQDSFFWVEYWLSNLKQMERKRNFKILHIKPKHANVVELGESSVYEDEDEDDQSFFWRLVPGKGDHLIWYNKKPLWITRGDKDAPSGNGSGKNAYIKPEIIRIRTLGIFAKHIEPVINDIVDTAKKLEKSKQKKTIKYYVYNGDYWHRQEDIMPRSLDSLITKEGVVENLVEDAKAFAANRSWYVDRGIPYRRGYLLYGPPGTGKTSLISAFAPVLNRPVYNLNLGTIHNNGQLIRAMSEVSPRGILLIEDIDSVKAARDRKTQTEEKDEKINLATLLNVIDGLSASEGRILIMTTNHPEKLDEALLRPGRVDKKIHFDYLDADLATKMFFRFYPKASLDEGTEFRKMITQPVSPAKLQSVFMTHPENHKAAMQEMNDVQHSQ